MKSRVQKNRELHQKLSNSVETEVETKELSQFANRLNQIDDQFKKMSLPEEENHYPQRARHNAIQKEILIQKQDENESVSFDTFESTYLKDFLDEVKEYNVKKGYRDMEDTQSNIMSKITGSTPTKKASDDPIQSVLNEIDADLAVSEDQDMEMTRIFSVNNLQETETHTPSETSDLDHTIAMAVQEMVQETDSNYTPQESAIEDGDLPSIEEDFELNDEMIQEELSEPDEMRPSDKLDNEESFDSIDIEESLIIDDDNFDIDDFDVDSFTNDTFHRELIEQTQTLQHRIVDQEKHIEDMSDTIVRTNRMLNAVLAILLLAIFVVIVLIAVQFSKIF